MDLGIDDAGPKRVDAHALGGDLAAEPDDLALAGAAIGEHRLGSQRPGTTDPCGQRIALARGQQTTEALLLSACRPAEARVGWLAPAYDQLPRKEAVIESAGRFYDSGIYAHAPALHRYDLAGTWNRLRGACGLPTQSGGSVVFVIRGDGKELFRSPKVVPGKTVTFDIALAGIATLELVTEDGGDGQAADWGVWLAPELLR